MCQRKILKWRLNLVLLWITFDSHLGWLNALRRKSSKVSGPLTTFWGSLTGWAPRGCRHPSPSSNAVPSNCVPYLSSLHTQYTLSQLWRLPSVPDFWALSSELRQHLLPLQFIWNVSAANLNCFFSSFCMWETAWYDLAQHHYVALFSPTRL